MRVFAVSDIHVDYPENANWVFGLSREEFRDDLLILAGDLTDRLPLLDRCLRSLKQCFKEVLFVPGNHELWVLRDAVGGKDSLWKFDSVCAAVEETGATMRPFLGECLTIIPLLGWYDLALGQPSKALRDSWMDYRACRWPVGFDQDAAAAHFAALNEPLPERGEGCVISFSHFLPRIDVMPSYISERGAPALSGSQFSSNRAPSPEDPTGHARLRTQPRQSPCRDRWCDLH